MPLWFEYEKEDLEREIPPLEDIKDPFYAIAFAELAATIAQKFVDKELSSSDYINLMADLIFTEFEEKDKPFIWVPYWYKSLLDTDLDAQQKAILIPVMADLSAIVFTIYAVVSGYRFTEIDTGGYTYNDIIPIREKLLTDEVKGLLNNNDLLTYTIFNPILDTVLSFMPYRNETVDNQLASYIDIQKNLSSSS